MGHLTRMLKLMVVFLLIWTSGLPIVFSQLNSNVDVQVFQNLVYYQGTGFDNIKHRLDIYQPITSEPTPVLIFIHGGGWTFGDKNLYTNVGQTFARFGLTTVLVNYRLSPGVRHPSHIQDVASAFAWVYENIHIFSGDRENIFVMGHSAGGHLASLLALNKNYLQAEGLSNAMIDGVVAISGVYLIEPDSNILRSVFTSNPALRLDASPIDQFSLPAPPFLFLYAQFELPTLDFQAQTLHRLFVNSGGVSEIEEIRFRNHESIVERIGQFNDATTNLIQQFILRNI